MPAATTGIPALRFSHIGIATMDIEKMEDFYKRVLGMTVTDRGEELGFKLVFMSRDPNDHHQFVLSNGRPEDLPQNTVNPVFGPIVIQMSYALTSLDELKAFNDHLMKEAPGEYMYANHGTAWSIYFPDPEGNVIEAFVDTEWYIKQPVFEPLDITASDEAIIAQTEEICANGENFEPIAQWRARMAKEMGVAWAE